MARREPKYVQDASTSMLGYAAPGSDTTKAVLAREIAKELVAAAEEANIDTAGTDELTPEGISMGGLAAAWFNDGAGMLGEGIMHNVYPTVKRDEAEEHAGDLNSYNFNQLWDTIPWDGSTFIMQAIKLHDEEYHEEFDSKPANLRPDPLYWISTDGALNDPELFTPWLANQPITTIIGVIVLGFGSAHDNAVRSWKNISARHPNVKVYEANGNTNAKELASQLISLLQ